jgi:hypothetical protein
MLRLRCVYFGIFHDRSWLGSTVQKLASTDSFSLSCSLAWFSSSWTAKFFEGALDLEIVVTPTNNPTNNSATPHATVVKIDWLLVLS